VERVVILPDNDDPGRDHAAHIAASCSAAGLTVKVVTLPDLPAAGDVSDWLDAGHTKGELAAIVQQTPVYATPASAPVIVSGLVSLTGTQLVTHVFPHRRALLLRGDTAILREGHLGQIYAERGVGKTWLMTTLALVAIDGGEAMGFRAPTPVRVLHVDGEMASEEVKERYLLMVERLNLPLTDNITIVAADWQDDFQRRLDTPDGQAMLEPFIATADVILLDNRSCLFDPEGEKDPSAWQPAQDWFLSLRRRGKAVLFAHHSNRQGGARGHSKAEDPLNLLIKLTRPEGYTQDQGAKFMLTFEKSRGAHGPGVAPFTAHLAPDGWQITGSKTEHRNTATDKLIEYLRLAHDIGERPRSANQAITRAHFIN
jgi:putative DNA primase/helicase